MLLKLAVVSAVLAQSRCAARAEGYTRLEPHQQLGDYQHQRQQSHQPHQQQQRLRTDQYLAGTQQLLQQSSNHYSPAGGQPLPLLQHYYPGDLTPHRSPTAHSPELPKTERLVSQTGYNNHRQHENKPSAPPSYRHYSEPVEPPFYQGSLEGPQAGPDNYGSETSDGKRNYNDNSVIAAQPLIDLVEAAGSSYRVNSRQSFSRLYVGGQQHSSIGPSPAPAPAATHNTAESLNSLFDYPPRPYEFGYDSEDGYGNKQSRREESDEYNNKRGSYSFVDANGVFRHVDYIADAHGFRAHVRTNEPGTADSTPADARIEAQPITLADQAAAAASAGIQARTPGPNARQHVQYQPQQHHQQQQRHQHQHAQHQQQLEPQYPQQHQQQQQQGQYSQHHQQQNLPQYQQHQPQYPQHRQQDQQLQYQQQQSQYPQHHEQQQQPQYQQRQPHYPQHHQQHQQPQYQQQQQQQPQYPQNHQQQQQSQYPGSQQQQQVEYTQRQSPQHQQQTPPPTAGPGGPQRPPGLARVRIYQTFGSAVTGPAYYYEGIENVAGDQLPDYVIAAVAAAAAAQKDQTAEGNAPDYETFGGAPFDGYRRA